jgi:hypothetical protein
MVTISISAAAFAAIASTLPKGSIAKGSPDGKGGYYMTASSLWTSSASTAHSGIASRATAVMACGAVRPDLLVALASCQPSSALLEGMRRTVQRLGRVSPLD